MNITCDSCKTKLNIPDHKIPKDKDTTVKCPKCQGKIHIQATRQPPTAGNVSKLDSELLLDPLTEEKLMVLSCVDSSDLNIRIKTTIKPMGLDMQNAKDVPSAMKMMEYHVYNLVLIDEAFDSDKGLSIVEKMNKFDMSLRRRSCIVLISKKLKTNDNMFAMHASVNQTINVNDMDKLDGVIKRALKKHRNFYTVYNDSLRATGKA